MESRREMAKLERRQRKQKREEEKWQRDKSRKVGFEEKGDERTEEIVEDGAGSAEVGSGLQTMVEAPAAVEEVS